MSGLGGVLEPLRIKNKELVQLASSALVDWVIVAVRQAVQQFGTRPWVVFMVLSFGPALACHPKLLRHPRSTFPYNSHVA